MHIEDQAHGKKTLNVNVNYGGGTKMTNQHQKEFAWGLAESKHFFLWIIRFYPSEGDYAIISKELLEDTKDRGVLASWYLKN